MSKFLDWCYKWLGFPAPKIDVGSVWAPKGIYREITPVVVTNISLEIASYVVEYQYDGHPEFGYFTETMDDFLKYYSKKT